MGVVGNAVGLFAAAMALTACNSVLGIGERPAQATSSGVGGAGGVAPTSTNSAPNGAGTGSGGSGGAAGAGGATNGAGAGGDAAGGAGGALACDPRFTISPAPPTANAPLFVTFSDDIAWTFVDLQLVGPGAPLVVNFDLSQFPVGTWNWTHEVNGHAPGVLSLTFVHDTSVVEGACDVVVVP
jgi:hypothetical protein